MTGNDTMTDTSSAASASTAISTAAAAANTTTTTTTTVADATTTTTATTIISKIIIFKLVAILVKWVIRHVTRLTYIILKSHTWPTYLRQWQELCLGSMNVLYFRLFRSVSGNLCGTSCLV